MDTIQLIYTLSLSLPSYRQFLSFVFSRTAFALEFQKIKVRAAFFIAMVDEFF